MLCGARKRKKKRRKRAIECSEAGWKTAAEEEVVVVTTPLVSQRQLLYVAVDDRRPKFRQRRNDELVPRRVAGVAGCSDCKRGGKFKIRKRNYRLKLLKSEVNFRIRKPCVR